MAHTMELRLAGPAGEAVDLWRTFVSHGIAELPPMRVDESTRTFAITLPVPRARPRMVEVAAGRRSFATVTVSGRAPGAKTLDSLMTTLRHVLGLDENLSEFYALAASDPDLEWVTSGAGRMIRSPTVFETVAKTICTTNCSWAATRRMVHALVEHLGEPAVGAAGRAFPTPEALASAGDGFLREVARAGYRGPYLIALAHQVLDGLDLEQLDPSGGLHDDEVYERLLELPGVGPYAAAHIMMMLGRHSRLILDSWTRPKYARLVGRKRVADATIVRRFRRYGPYAGLAFWLFLTHDWVADR
ncbi:MAG: DNA-3-methyladenine glycosylase family protein [Actinomycetota bacterium]